MFNFFQRRPLLTVKNWEKYPRTCRCCLIMWHRILYPLLKLISLIYFKIVSILFEMLNCFQRKESVERPENALLLISATDAAELIRNHEITSADLITAYIDRIKSVDPLINAVVAENFADALKQAEKVDSYLEKLDKNSDEFKDLPYKKPLLGLPFTVKDSFSVEGFRLTAGMPCKKDLISTEDADIVIRVKDAGAILLAITNVPEVVMWCETNNQLFGRTRNPYDLRRSAGGSSGGEGALIAAAGSLFGIGSDIGGSIRMPSIYNGIFGLKISESLVPQKGSFPVARFYREKMLSIGPLCRYAKDLPMLLRVFVGNEVSNDVLGLNQPVAVRKSKFFYMEGINSCFIQPVSPSCRRALNKTVKYFEKKYDTTVYKIDFPKAHHALGIFLASMFEENSPPFTKMLTDLKGDVSIVKEIVKVALGTSDHTAASMMLAILDSLPIPSPETIRFIRSHRDALRREIIELLSDGGILIFPSHPTVAPYHNKPLFCYFDFNYTSLFSALRLPVVVCPLGLNSEGLPTSVQIVGAPNSDKLLCAVASDLEEGFNGWKPPRGTKNEYD